MSTNFYNNLIDDIVRKIVIDNNNSTANGDNNLSEQEKDVLKSLGIDTDKFNVANYTGTLNKFGANKAQEREQILAQLKGFIEKILELLPENTNITSEFNTLIGEAHNANSLQDFFKVFTNKIEELQGKNKSDANKELEMLLLKNTSYKAFMSTEDYQSLVEILPKSDNVNNISSDKSTNSGNTVTTITFTYNDKNYTFRINENIDTSGLKGNTKAGGVDNQVPPSVEDFEKVMLSFARGELRYSDFVKAIEPFGFDSKYIYDNMHHEGSNDGYTITLKYGGKEYKVNCNMEGALDGNDTDNKGKITYDLLEPSKLKNRGLSEDVIKTYFVEAVVVDGEVKYYTKNQITWDKLGVTSNSIDDLKKALDKQEKLKHVTEVVNEVITELTSKHSLNSDEVRQLREYLQNGNAKTTIEGLLEKSDDQIKSQVTSLAETYITGTIRKTGTKSTDSIDTSSLTNAQITTINTVCNTISSAVGISSATLTDRVKAAATEFASATDFKEKVQEKALDIAQEILKETNQSNSSGKVSGEDIYTLVSDYGDNPSLALLSKIHDYEGLAGLKINISDTPDNNGTYTVTITYSDGSTTVSGDAGHFTSDQLRSIGFYTESKIWSNNNINNISDSQKAEKLLEICRGFMKNPVTNGTNSRKLTFEEAMDVFNKVKSDNSYKDTYTNINTFENAISTKANEFAKEKVKTQTANSRADSTSGTTNTGSVDFDSPEFTAYLSYVTNALQSQNIEFNINVENNNMYFNLYDKSNYSNIGELIINGNGELSVNPNSSIALPNIESFNARRWT